MQFCARFLAGILAVGLAAGCSSSNNPVPSPTPTPGSLTKQQQALQADAAMGISDAIRIATTLASVVNPAPGAVASPAAAIPCKDGIERETIVTPPTITIVLRVFYDRACTAPFVKLNAQGTIKGTTVTLAGTQTTYDPKGNRIDYGVLSGTLVRGSTSSQLDITAALSRAKGAPPRAHFGLSCTLGTTNACGFGAIQSITPGESTGATAALSGIITSGTTDSGKVTAEAYTGSPGALVLKPGKNNTWVVSGGKRRAGQSGTFSESVNPKALKIKIRLALTDLVNPVGSLSTRDRNGITGHVLLLTPGTVLKYAKFQTDAVGTGTITYHGGSTGKIALFFVLP
jgi:hypothetical protein